MSFIHSSTFAYVKNLIIGLGASVVLIGALFKILSWPGANEALMAGLFTEAGLFLMLGILPPHKDYYWEKLYPGLDKHGGEIEAEGANFDGSALTKAIEGTNQAIGKIQLDTSGLEGQQEKMIGELQTMAKSMSSLKALQEADFSEIKNVTQGAGKFAAALSEAVSSISESLEDTRVYKEQLSELNTNLKALNGVYKDAAEGEFKRLSEEVNKFAGALGDATGDISSSLNDTKAYREYLAELNNKMKNLNSVYGNVLAAMGQGKA